MNPLVSAAVSPDDFILPIEIVLFSFLGLMLLIGLLVGWSNLRARARRSGPRPVPAARGTSTGDGATRLNASTVADAITGFHRLARECPTVGADTLRAEWTDLSGSWAGPRLVLGTLTEVTETVRANLERDRDVRGCRNLLVTSAVSPTPYVQVNSINLQTGRFYGHRVWFTAQGCGLFSSAADAIAPDRSR